MSAVVCRFAIARWVFPCALTSSFKRTSNRRAYGAPRFVRLTQRLARLQIRLVEERSMGAWYMSRSGNDDANDWAYGLEGHNRPYTYRGNAR